MRRRGAVVALGLGALASVWTGIGCSPDPKTPLSYGFDGPAADLGETLPPTPACASA